MGAGVEAGVPRPGETDSRPRFLRLSLPEANPPILCRPNKPGRGRLPREQRVQPLDDRFGGEPEALREVLPGGRGSEAVEALDGPPFGSSADVALPAEGDAGLDCQALGDRGRQDRVLPKGATRLARSQPLCRSRSSSQSAKRETVARWSPTMESPAARA